MLPPCLLRPICPWHAQYVSEPMLTESGHFNNTIVPKRSTSLTPPKTYGIDLKMSVTAIKGDGDKLPGSERVTACDNM